MPFVEEEAAKCMLDVTDNVYARCDWQCVFVEWARAGRW